MINEKKLSHPNMIASFELLQIIHILISGHVHLKSIQLLKKNYSIQMKLYGLFSIPIYLQCSFVHSSFLLFIHMFAFHRVYRFQNDWIVFDRVIFDYTVTFIDFRLLHKLLTKRYSLNLDSCQGRFIFDYRLDNINHSSWMMHCHFV